MNDFMLKETLRQCDKIIKMKDKHDQVEQLDNVKWFINKNYKENLIDENIKNLLIGTVDLYKFAYIKE